MAVDVEDDVAVPALLATNDLTAFLDDVDRRPRHAPGSEDLDRRIEVPDEALLHGTGRGRKHEREHANENP
jgi:hypothetical protein